MSAWHYRVREQTYFKAFTNACFWLLEPEKLQLVTQKQVIVDAHGCIITHLFQCGIRADIYTQRGFLHCLFGYTVFSGPQQRISERESAFFMSVCNQAMKTISEISYQIRTSQKLREFIRFAIVGVLATGIHYGIYLLLLWLYDIEQDETTYADIAYTIGYVLSFLCNLWLTAHYTFREKLTIKRGGGFALSHIINYLLHSCRFSCGLVCRINGLLFLFIAWSSPLTSSLYGQFSNQRYLENEDNYHHHSLL